MAPKSCGPEMAERDGGRMIHDVGSDFEVPLPMLSGRNGDWPIWSARCGAYAELGGWSAVLEVAEAQTPPISMVGAAPGAIRVGKIVCAVLLTETEGKTCSTVPHLTAQKGGSRSVETLARAKRCESCSAAWNHGACRGVPERAEAGEPE